MDHRGTKCCLANPVFPNLPDLGGLVPGISNKLPGLRGVVCRSQDGAYTTQHPHPTCHGGEHFRRDLHDKCTVLGAGGFRKAWSFLLEEAASLSLGSAPSLALSPNFPAQPPAKMLEWRLFHKPSLERSGFPPKGSRRRLHKDPAVSTASGLAVRAVVEGCGTLLCFWTRDRAALSTPAWPQGCPAASTCCPGRIRAPAS